MDADVRRGLGHEYPAVLAVLAAFFAGFAVGGWALDGVVSRSRRPGTPYAALEGVISLRAEFEGRFDEALALNVSSARARGDLPAAYHVLVRLARDRLSTDPAAARRILRAAAEANPARPEVRELLRQIGG